MWQSNSRKRSDGNWLHCVELRSSREFHLKRVTCRIAALDGAPASTPIEGRLLLNDISTQGVAVYAPDLLPLGSIVTIDFEYPEKTTLKARVGWCQQLTGVGKVITERSQSFRIGLVFEHEKPEDQERFRTFCEKLAEIYPGIDLTRAPYAA
jgi:hypothetical protein